MPTRADARSPRLPAVTIDLSLEWTAIAPPDTGAHGRCTREACATRSTESRRRGLHRAEQRRLPLRPASRQASYERAYDRLFAALDRLEERLTDRRYLVGDHVTEADVRLFTTLVRFDPVYHGHFKANRNKLVEMPALWGYARDLFQTPGFGDTVDFEHVKRHYYVVHSDINPTQIVPKGPDLAGWLTPHGREALGGRRSGTGPRRPRAARGRARPLGEHRAA